MLGPRQPSQQATPNRSHWILLDLTHPKIGAFDSARERQMRSPIDVNLSGV